MKAIIPVTAGIVAIIGGIVGGVWALDSRFYQRPEAIQAHKKLEDFTIQVAGRLDAKMRKDDIRAARRTLWDILKHYKADSCYVIPLGRDRRSCLENAADLKDLEAEKKKRR